MLTVFLSAFLLFQIQPLIGKYILPWFGGTPSVWSTAMLFFQALLVGGYAYAHWLVGRLSPRRQAIVHLALLGVSLGLLLALGLAWDSPITPGVRWKPQGTGNPQWQVLRILAVAVGLPYLILSANSPLMQVWFSYPQSVRALSPHRLYALSNAGSLLGLLTFPFLVEPMLALKAQANFWVWGYVVFAACVAYITLRVMRLSAASPDHIATSDAPKAWPAAKGRGRPGVRVRLLWVALSACGSIMLLATTNQISQEVSVTPFLWVLPLALYLFSFVLCFSGRRWYWRAGYAVALFVTTGFFCSVFCYGRGTLLAQIGVYGIVLFVCCMICHGELARLQPHPRYLTLFYLLISVGGTLGGVVVNLVAPHLFPGFWELPIGLLATWVLLLLVFFGSERLDRGRWLNLLADWLARGLEGGVVILGVVLFFYANNSLKDVLWSSRNYYGVLRVKERDTDRPYQRAYALLHGDTVHGFQILTMLDEERRPLPTAYYAEESGMGLAILNHPRRDAGLRIGAVGLGVGTLAAYGHPGDTIRFYEINPDVIRLAEGEGGHFTYLRDCPAQVEIVPGDARVSMERELAAGNPQQFDLLVVDAFNSGSVPVHLLTREAFDVYLRHLRPDGIVALHISNPYLDLGPVVQGLADHFQLGTAFIIDDGGSSGRGYWSAWTLVTRDGEFLERPEIAGRSGPRRVYEGFRLWTDDYSSVLPILLNRRPLAEGLLGDAGPQ
jgi:spermidine synthase